MKRYLLAGVSLLALAGVAQAQTVGQVWTYKGPSLGNQWATPTGGAVVPGLAGDLLRADGALGFGTSLTPGTGVATALGVSVGSAGAFTRNNGDVLSGTFSGTPTFSGALTFSAIPLFTGLSAGTQVSCMGLDSGNHLVLLASACGGGGSGITALTGDVTASGTGSVAATIASAVVTNAKLATMGAHTHKGNATGSTAAPVDLTTAQLTADLNAVVGDSGAGGTKGLVPAPAAGDAAAGKFFKADGTFAVPPGGSATPGGSSGQLQYNNAGAFGGGTLGTGLDLTGGVLSMVIVPNAQTGASYTLATTDSNKSVNMTNASATAVTVLAAATAGANYGTYVYCKAGCTLARSGSDTINGGTSLVLAANQAVSLTSDGTLTWTANILPALDPSNGANLQAGTVANAKLANSTISGIALGSNLAALSSTDATLTFSCSYTGATACTIGLALGNPNTWTAGLATTPVPGGSVTGTVTPDANSGNDWTYTLGGNITLANPSNIRAGQTINIVLTQDGSGPRLISTWGSFYKFPGGTKPTLSTAAGAVDMLTCRTITTTYIACGYLLNLS